MEDPVAHFQKEVDALNLERSQQGVRKISERSPLLYIGYFPLKAILTKLHIKKYVDYFKFLLYFHSHCLMSLCLCE